MIPQHSTWVYMVTPLTSQTTQHPEGTRSLLSQIEAIKQEKRRLKYGSEARLLPWYTQQCTSGGSTQRDCHSTELSSASAQTQGFLWAANMKVFLWCWLCYFQAEGWRTSQCLCFYLAGRFIPFILAAIKGGNCVVDKHWTKSTVSGRLLKNWLHAAYLAWSWFIHLSCGSGSQAPLSSETESKRFVISNVFLFVFSPLLLLWNTDPTSRRPRLHHRVSPSRPCLLSDSCVCVCVCMLYVCSCPCSPAN